MTIRTARRLFLHPPTLLPVLVALGLLGLASRASAEVRLVGSDAGGVTLEFRLEGFRLDTVTVDGRRYGRVRLADGIAIGAPGEPELPGISTLVGVPVGAEPRVSVVQMDASEQVALPPEPIESQMLTPQPGGMVTQVSEQRADPQAYARSGWWPVPVAVLGPQSTLRYQTVQSVGVHPVRYDAARGVLWVARRVVVRVDFGAPVQTPTGLLGGAGTSESRAEESLYRGAVLNYEQARAFRLSRPEAGIGPARRARPQRMGGGAVGGARSGVPGEATVGGAAGSGAASGGAGIAAGAIGFPDFKLRVDTTGIYKVTYDQLRRRFPTLDADTLSLSQLRCWEELPGPYPHSYGTDPEFTRFQRDVPLRVVDLNHNGLFDHGDYAVFFGLNLADRFHARWFDTDRSSRFYTAGEVYWLGRRAPGSPAPARIEERGGSLGLAAPYRPGSYKLTVHREDHIYQVQFPGYADQNVYPATGPFDDDTLAFDAFDVDPVRPIQVRTAIRGAFDRDAIGGLGIHYYTLYLMHPQGEMGTSSDLVELRRRFFDRELDLYDTAVDPTFTLDGSHLGEGHNVLRFVGEHPTSTGSIVPGSGAMVDWFEVGYYRRYLAPDGTGRMDFSSGDTLGPLELHADRFLESSVEVYDLTDSLAPRFIAAQTSASAEGWQASFQDTASGAPHHYFAAGRGALPVLPDAAVSVDTASDLAGVTGADMLIITHESLEAQAQQLAAQRRLQGLSVVVARVGDIYDEFDGGRKSEVAIKRLLRRAYYLWQPAPRYLLLLGEGSENPQAYLTTRAPSVVPPMFQSHRDLVPSPRGFGSVPLSGTNHELVAEDYWYTVGLDTTDRYPVFAALAAGRINSGNPVAAQDMVDKIVKYEHPAPDESWRSRNLYVSDDTWSNGIGFSGNVLVRNDGSESAFRRISRMLPEIVSQEGGFQSFGADTFFLADYTDTAHVCDIGSGQRDYACESDYGHGHIGPLLSRKMARGALLLNYQGHANASVWTHEHILINDDIADTTDQVDALGNRDRPFLAIAFACHVNKYDAFDKEANYIGNGRSLGERLVAARHRGAVASFASVGYEWLPGTGDRKTGVDLNLEVMRSFFVHPPTPDVEGDRGVKWIAGDVVRDAKARFLVRSLGLLGDGSVNFGALGWCGYACRPPFLGRTNENPYEVFTYCLLGDPALRMDPGAASFQLVQDGQPLDSFGYFRGGGSTDSVTLEALAQSPVGLDSAWVEQRMADGTVRVVPRSAYTVTREALNATDSVATHPRELRVTFRTAPALEDYYLDFKARNVDGVVSVSSLHRVLALGEITSNRGQVDEQHVLPADITFQITLTSSTPVDSSRLGFYLNGHPMQATQIAMSQDPLDQGGLRHWTYSLHGTFPAGTNELCLRNGIEAGGSVTISKCARFKVAATNEFVLGEVVNYPNPFEITTGFHYSLTQPVDRVTVRIYTLSGHMIREIDDPNHEGGVHFLGWDGTDADHDHLANGVYLYKVTASAGGRTLEKMGQMIKVQ